MNLFLAAALTSACVASHAFAGELTTIPAYNGFMTGASANGRVVCGYGSQYFYWTKETSTIFIGGLGPGQQGAGGSASVSGSGATVSMNALNSNGKLEPAIYTIADGSMQLLGNLGASCDIGAATSWGMSGDGQRVVGGAYPTACGFRAIQTSVPGPMSQLYSWFGWVSRANGANLDGNTIVGWQDIATGFRQGCLWNQNVQTRIQTPAGVRMGEAQCCTADGSNVFGFGNFNNGQGQVPYRWTLATGPVALASVMPDPAPGFATACSADGGVIACFFRYGAPAISGEGYLYIAGRGFVAIEQWATEQGVEVPAGVRLSLPLGVSADGKTIVGSGRNDTDGTWIIFVLDTHAAVVPCPSDLNGDGVVSGADLGILLGAWGTCAVVPCTGDLNTDGQVNGADLGILLGDWGACP